MLRAASALVRIPSWGGDETPAQEQVAALVSDAGLTLDQWDIDVAGTQKHPDCSWEIEREHAMGVVGSLEGSGDGPILLLNGHVDVVPPGDERLWAHPPFSGVVADGFLHGRGALDMKGPLMAGLYALKAVRGSGVRLRGSARLVSVVGEEDGGLGTLAAILRGYTGDGAIVMEPTDLAVAPVQAGCLNFRLRVPGLAAHGAVREEGVSAFEKLFVVFQALQRLEQERNAVIEDPGYARYRIPYPISVGTLGGGDWASSVPDHARMEGRIGVRPGETLAEARAALEGCVAQAAAADAFLSAHPPLVEWWGGRFLPASTPLDHPVASTLMQAVGGVTGRPARIEGVTFGADAGLLQHVGNTRSVLFGAGDIRAAHRPDERVRVADLETMGRALAAMIVGFCGVDGGL